MSYVVEQSVAHSVPVKLVADDDFRSQVTGKGGGDVTVRYKQYGASSWSSKDVSASGWDEIGNGYYEIDLTAGELDTLGRFDYQVECSGCLDYNGAVVVVSHDPLSVQQDGSGYLKVRNESGNKIAEHSDIQNVLRGLGIYVTGEVDSGARGTTYAQFTCAPNRIAVGDLLVWPADKGVGNEGAIMTRVTAVDGTQVTWTPALPSVPAEAVPVVFVADVGEVAIGGNPTGGSVNERVKAIDDKLPSGDISDFDAYRGCANVGYDGETLTVNAWLEHRGQLVVDPTSVTVTVYDDSGTQAFELSDDTPDAQGVFKMTKSSPGFGAGKSYYAKVQVVASGETYTTVEGVATL